jgi:uncharacterized protein YaaR (DUF327 family)
MLARRYVKTRITAIFCQVSRFISDSTILARPEFGLDEAGLIEQNGKTADFLLIFSNSRQNDDEDTLRSQQHQLKRFGDGVSPIRCCFVQYHF